jgi:hypothetical protein
MNALSAGLAGALGKQIAPLFNLPQAIRLNCLIGLSARTDCAGIHEKLTFLFYIE